MFCGNDQGETKGSRFKEQGSRNKVQGTRFKEQGSRRKGKNKNQEVRNKGILNYTDITNELLTVVGSPVRIIASN